MKRFVVSLFLLLPSAFYLQSAFLDYGWGVRAEGMAGAFTSISNDTNAIFYNPAGLTQIYRKELNLMYTKPWLGLNGIDISFFHAIFAYPTNKYGCIAFGLTQYDANQMYSENMIVLGYGYDIGSLIKPNYKFLAGLNIKYLAWGVTWDEEIKKLDDPVVKSGNTKFAPAVDLGIILEPVSKLKIGFLGKNINSPNIGLYYENKLPAEFRSAIGYNFGDLGRFEDFTAEINASYRNQEHSENTKFDYSIGFETWLNFNTFGLRAGFKKTDFTFGASYYPRIEWNTIRLKFDYAVLISTVFSESLGSHKISLGIEF